MDISKNNKRPAIDERKDGVQRQDNQGKSPAGRLQQNYRKPEPEPPTGYSAIDDGEKEDLVR